MKNEAHPVQKDLQINELDREGLYRTIYSRRDVRGQFLSRAVSGGRFESSITGGPSRPKRRIHAALELYLDSL